MGKAKLFAPVIAVLLVVAVAAGVGFYFYSQGKTSSEDALDFNNEIIDEQSKVVQEFLGFNDLVSSGDPEEIREKYQDSVDVAKDALENVKNIEVVDGGEDFKSAAVELFTFYAEVLDEDYRELMEIVIKDSDEITDEDRERAKDIVEEISAKESDLDSNFAKVQKAFAKKYDLDLEANELQDEIDNLR